MTGDAADDHPALQVLTTGLQALFQDLGRAGQAGQGVSASGALDRRTFKAANRLVGNAPGATAIEIVDGGFTVRALQAVVVAVTGAVGPLTRESPARQADAAQGARVRETVPRGAPLALDAGDVLAVGAAQAGLRSYLAVRGGLAVAPVLGSCATDTLSAVGPAPIRAGQYLSVSFQGTTESVSYPEESCVALPTPGEPVTLDLTIGPRAEWFGPEAFALLQSQDWTVSAQSNRVGLRLRGDAPLQRRPEWRTAELASEGMVPGVLQVPPDGQPVLFLADHPLTGGYPVIACVATHHIDLAGQLPVGARVRFRLSSAPT
jgi:biotin-dependent carboxylase-like uncharacterized protein